MAHWGLWFGLLSLAMVVALLLYIRLAPSDPARWHVDPLTAPDPGRPHFARLDLMIDIAPETAAIRLRARAEAEGGTRLAGDDAHATWLLRTRLMGYPDYVSILLIPADRGTRVVALSRSRFGRSDWGVNAARLARWFRAWRRRDRRAHPCRNRPPCGTAPRWPCDLATGRCGRSGVPRARLRAGRRACAPRRGRRGAHRPRRSPPPCSRAARR